MRVVPVAVERTVALMVVAVMMRVVVRLRVGIGLGGKPLLDVGDFAGRIEQTAAENLVGAGFAFDGIENRRRRSERKTVSGRASRTW